jgi:hypothetical protein
MSASQHSNGLVLEVLRASALPLTFEAIISRVPELSWNQVFHAVDALSRSGEIILKRRGFKYHAAMAPAETVNEVDKETVPPASNLLS